MTETSGLSALHPPFGLVIRAGELQLRVLQDRDLPEYAELIQRPIFADLESPHVFPWYRAEPADRVRNALAFQWSLRAQLSPESWTLPFGVWRGDRLVGCQDLNARDFRTFRTVGSGSWLTVDQQGQGLGSLMRRAILTFAFDHLGAERAQSSAVIGNTASYRVSYACGYRDNGIHPSSIPGSTSLEQHFLVTPETFVRAAVPVEVEGMTAELREMLGA